MSGSGTGLSGSPPRDLPAADLASAGEKLRSDLVAGVTNGILAVPQGIAFALIAHVPPQHGLYAMIIPTIVAALIRSSPFLITGSTNTSALVIGALVASLAVPRDEIVPTMLLITLLMGLIQVSCGALRMGRFGRYVSEAVLIGFTLGAATLIFTDQIKNILGVPVASSPRWIGALAALLPRLGSTDVRALAIAGATWAILFGCAAISRLIPGAMIAVVATGALVWALGWGEGPTPVALVGEIPRTLPQLTLPHFSVEKAEAVFASSLAIALLGMVEAISIGKALSRKARIKFYADQELLAKGAGNVVGAFFGCMPSSASWTRSAINMQMGAKTRWAGVIAGIAVLAIMLVFAPWARYLPKACLGALIAWIALHMVDLTAARTVWQWSRADAAVLVITCVSTLLLDIQYAIYLGVFVSLLMLVRRAGTLHLVEMVSAASKGFREIEIDPKTGSYPVVLLQLEGDLFFGVVEELEEKLEQVAQNGARAIIIRLKRTHAIDASAAASLAAFAEHFKTRGGRMVLCGLKPELYEQIARSYLGEALGPENVLRTEAQVFGSIRNAIDAARRDISAQGLRSLDKPMIRPAPADLPDAPSYSI